MVPAQSQEFTHREIHRGDRFERTGNTVFFAIRNFAVALMWVVLAAVPGALVVMAVMRPVEWIGGKALADSVFHVTAVVWILMFIPLGLFFSWRRSMRLRHNRFTVDARGVGYLNWPRPRLEVAWSEIRKIRYTGGWDIDDGAPTDLVFETARGNFRLKSDDWPIDPIQSAIEQRYKIGFDRDAKPRP